MLRVIYRSGGTWNYKWRAVSERFTNPAKAMARMNELRRAGYFSVIEEAPLTATMPVAYEYDPAATPA